MLVKEKKEKKNVKNIINTNWNKQVAIHSVKTEPAFGDTHVLYNKKKIKGRKKQKIENTERKDEHSNT